MAQTIGKRWSASAPRWDHQAACDICGVPWRRSVMRRSRGGLLLCPQDQKGREALECDEANLAAQPRPPLVYPTDGGVLPPSPYVPVEQAIPQTGKLFELRADQNVTYDAANVVSDWNGGFQGIYSRRPIYEATGWLGKKPCVKFVGANDTFLTWDGQAIAKAPSGSDTPFTVLLVLEFIAVPATTDIWLSWGASAIDNNMAMGAKLTKKLYVGKYDGVVNKEFNGSFELFPATRHQFLFRSEGATATLFFDGNREVVGSIDVATVSYDTFTMGRHRSKAFGGFACDARIAHMIYWNRALNTGEIPLVANAMRAIWGGLP